MTVVRRGKLVVIREKRVSDAWDDYSWRADQELARLDAAVPLRLPFADYLRIYSEELQVTPPSSRRLAIDTVDGKHIGNCMYYDIDSIRQQGEMGIMIGDRDYWGQGYGTDAVSTLVSHVFDDTPLRRLYLHTLDWNVRAQRCFEKCGFQSVRKVRRNAQGFLLMELYRTQWAAWCQRDGHALPQQEAVSRESVGR